MPPPKPPRPGPPKPGAKPGAPAARPKPKGVQVLRGGRGRQRQLIYGPGGGGKTFLALSEAAVAMGPSDVLYVIDSDNAVINLLEANLPQLGALTLAGEYVRDGGQWVARGDEDPTGNVFIYRWTDWEDFAIACRDVRDQANWDDWCLVDSVTKPWTAVQAWLVRRTHGEDMLEWLIDYKVDQMKAGKEGDKNMALVQDGAWQLINGMWDKAFMGPWVEDPPCHFVATCEAKALRQMQGDKGKDSEVVRGMYMDVGEKPDTQKSVGFKVRTVVYMQKAKVGKGRLLTVVKHWGVEELPEDVKVGSGDGMEDGAQVMLSDLQGWTYQEVPE